LISYADCCEHPKSSCGPGGRHGRLGATFSEAEVREALNRLDRLWDELFPAEQARIVQLLVERVEVQPDRLNVRLRTAGLTKLVDELRERPNLANARTAA
jgi:hypothetical protein